MNIFEKCNNFTKADEVKSLSLYPYFHPIQSNEGPVVRMDGKKMIMAGSNNYLGLTNHPKVKKAAIDAINRYGTGCSGSRYLTGTLKIHNKLEEKLAKFLNKESVLLFSTGYQTAFGVISTIASNGDYILSDKENHASLVSGAMLSKSIGAKFIRYKHSDVCDLESKLQNLPIDSSKIIITDGVFSVTGEISNLPEIIKLAKKYNSAILSDEAHSIGVIGESGKGVPHYYNCSDDIDLIIGTFSKSLASLGGFVAGNERSINYIKHHSPALIFSASPTPSSVASADAALDILIQQPELVEKLQENSDYIRKGMSEIGLNIIDGKSAIVPVIIGDADKTFIFWKKLFDKGIYVNAFVPPGVPPNLSMMRTSFMASHKKKHLDKVLDAFNSVAKELQLI